MENVNTGERVLTAEAQQEYAAIPTRTRSDHTPRATAVDVNDGQSLSSTQALTSQTQAHIEDNRLQASSESFPTYDSPFVTYPLLRSRLRRVPSPSLGPNQQEAELSSSSSLASSSFSSSVSSFIVSSHHLSALDLKPLKRVASFKALDPSKQICQYELPGGGICRDKGCQDVHLSRGLDGGMGMDEVEPSDADTAEYLCDVLLAAANDDPSWQTQRRSVIVGKIRDTLRGLQGNNKVYEDRVAVALGMLSSAAAPSRQPF